MLLITDQRGRDQFEFRWDSRWDCFLTRVRAPGLDRRLAAGSAPESDRLLAIRSRTLVAPPTRRMLARSWERLLDEDRRPSRSGHPRLPICRDRIVAAESDLRDMVAGLLAPLPVTARGVAMAISLLRDGTGPLYNRNCVISLPALVRRVVAELDPSIELYGSA